MKHAGVHWPEAAGGEHPDRETILSLPGMAGATLICSPSARYHYDVIRKRHPSAVVVWRAIPRQGRLPAQLGWDANKVADECLNLWDEQPHGGMEWFLPLNELQFVKESGQPFAGYAQTAERLSKLRYQLWRKFDERGQNVRLMFPAWVPSDDGDRAHEWVSEAMEWDAVALHAYGNADEIIARYHAYRDLLGPHMPIFLGEWNANHAVTDERETVQRLAELADTDPAFLGAAYYIWETRNDGEEDLSVWGNPSRLALFRDPPVISGGQPMPPTPAPEPSQPDKPAIDPWAFWSADEIAAATQCPADAVRETWPRLVEQLVHCGLTDKPTQIAMIGTVAIETARQFRPVREAFWLDEAWRAANLRYYPFYGRGDIQLTWEANYRTYGPKIAELWQTDPSQPDFDLVGNPDRALDPDISAAVAALYFRDHGGDGLALIPQAARAGDWHEVRRLVQGGDAGLDALIAIAAALGADQPQPAAGALYGPDVPDSIIRQRNNWSCAVRSTFAALWSMAQQGQGEPVTYGDGGPRDVYDWMVPAIDDSSAGLHDHTGAQLAALLRSKGYAASSAYPVTLAQVRERAGHQPVMVGGDAWNHWVMVRGVTDDGGLVLENPMPGHQAINDYMRDSWGRRGPFAMVWIDLPAAVEPSPPDLSLTDRLELTRAGLDDGADRPHEGMSHEAALASLVALWANIDRAYLMLGEIGDELRKQGV